ALLPRCPGRARRDRGDVPPAAYPPAGSAQDRPDRVAAIHVHLRAQAHPGASRSQLTRRHRPGRLLRVADTSQRYSEIGYLVADRIATITLSRPEKLNAFTHVMRGELIDAFDQADADDGVRAGVVTGRGRAF